MSDVDTPALLEAGVVRLRELTAAEAPFAGWLARMDEGVVHLVDVGVLEGWPGWSERGEHVLAVQDVLRTATGHAAILPWCVERLDRFIDRRVRGGAPFSAGEAVTIAVSVLRGCAALRRAQERGAWWLTQSGAPVFVCDHAAGRGELIALSSTRVIDTLTDSGAVAGEWSSAGLTATIAAETATDEAEARLFASASPEPLVFSPLTPRRVADSRAAPRTSVIVPAGRESVFARVVRRHVDADVGGLVSDAVEASRRCLRRVRERIARPWLVAAGVAAVILVGGVAWPATTAPAANARPETSVSSPEALPRTAEQPPAADEASSGGRALTGSGGPTGVEDPVAALEQLLTLREECAGDACAAQLYEDSFGTRLPPGAMDLSPNDREVSLVDDLGGVAIVRVVARDALHRAQLVVMVKSATGWVIRGAREVEHG